MALPKANNGYITDPDAHSRSAGQVYLAFGPRAMGGALCLDYSRPLVKRFASVSKCNLTTLNILLYQKDE